MASIKGHCLCEEIKVSIPKQESNALCHCTHCRRTSGATASGNFTVKLEEVKVEGSPKVYHDTGSSGKPIKRFFCGTCGSPLWAEADLVAGMAFVRTGLFDVGSIPKPDLHLFAKNMESWEKPYEGAEVKETE